MNTSSTSTNNKKSNVQEILSKYRKVGRIAIEAKKLAKKICKPGAKAYDVCESIESYIRKEGALPAFPVNISLNQEAAHYSADILDTRIVPENSIVKIDLGAHIDGYLVDTALTLNFNDDLTDLAEASKKALDAAIEIIKSGIRVSEIGKVIEQTIVDFGYQPVRNLSGHQIKRYILHAGVSIPNCGPSFFERSNAKIQAGRIYAIEPFSSTGKGWVTNGRTTNIYRYIKDPSNKSRDLKILAKEVKSKIGVLPFSPRHLFDKTTGKSGKELVKKQIRQLLRGNVIMGYPVLIEETDGSMVSQFEDTVRITQDGCEVLTR